MGRFSEVRDPVAFEKALALARGPYQRAILEGDEAISCSTLVGAAQNWRLQYKRSQANLFARMHAAGIPFDVVKGKYGKWILVIG